MQLYRNTTKAETGTENDQEALKLYCWNSALSRSLYWPLHGFEICLRNAMADRIYDKYGDNWYDLLTTIKGGNPLATNEEADKVAKAKLALTQIGEPHGHDSIVSSISLGFWEGLLKPEYAMNLWNGNDMFQGLFQGNTRNDVFRNVNQIKRLRNGIAHHEPIFVHWPSKQFRPLYQDFKKIIKVVRWISPDTASWIEHHSASDFYRTWNDAPNWLTVRQQLGLIPTASAAGSSESDNWRW